MFDDIRKRLFGRREPIEPVMAVDEIDDACAVLTMVARFHGRDVDPPMVERFIDGVAEDPRGRNAMDLVNAAAQLGLLVKGIKVEQPGGFGELLYPCIGHVVVTGDREAPDSPAYFVVLETFSAATGQLSIIDPLKGRRVEAGDEFFRRTSGVVLLFEPGQAIPKAVLRS